ncbi:MAG: RNA polymerase factor sigma-54 [bacterium]|jgi:RNA polymerase sigma-54 factor|nr:RNA polymerase factor sigma-54 [Candidatus Neomarinimicrobiota bacterium]HIL86105.1 RNA polymerase sigma-54 factor [Candidatus Neomarinimicrobiota bacterium]
MNKFSTKIRQKQSIIPKQILQSSFLELGLDDIEKELENEIQKNPVLIEKNIEDFKDKGYESYGLDNQENYDLFLSNLPEDKNVIDNLISQIDQSEIDKLSKEIAQQIILNVDNSGFLDSELELIADSTDSNMEDVESILEFVKTLNPKGVGCKNLQEYLILQMNQEEEIALNIIRDYFDEFLNQEFLDIKSSLSCSDTDFDNALSIISSKNFAPIVDLNVENQQINPDVILRMKDEEWIILINDRHLNRFKISNEYLNAAMNAETPKEEKKFIDDHISSAQNLLDTILFRSDTLRKVVNEIIHIQHDYLSEKQQHPNPLKLEDIAKKIDMDISSISRAVKNKYIDSPLGTLSLKSFFTSKIIKKSGKIVGAEELKTAIKDIVESEDKNQPLSDLEIVQLLDAKDFSIARRTVAKYRESMNILNTKKRKLK